MQFIKQIGRIVFLSSSFCKTKTHKENLIASGAKLPIDEQIFCLLKKKSNCLVRKGCLQKYRL